MHLVQAEETREVQAGAAGKVTLAPETSAGAADEEEGAGRPQPCTQERSEPRSQPRLRPRGRGSRGGSVPSCPAWVPLPHPDDVTGKTQASRL